MTAMTHAIAACPVATRGTAPIDAGRWPAQRATPATALMPPAPRTTTQASSQASSPYAGRAHAQPAAGADAPVQRQARGGADPATAASLPFGKPELLADADPTKEWSSLQRLQHEQHRGQPADAAGARIPAALKTLFP